MSFAAIATFFIVPPVNLIFLGLLGCLIGRRLGRAVASLALVGLLVLALPFTAGWLIYSLEAGLPFVTEGTAPAGDAAPGAIVVLSAELNASGDTPPLVTPGRLTLERLRPAAALARRTKLPILVTGGTVRRDVGAVAPVMARSLVDDFGVAPGWIEARSTDTWQNAEYSAALLAPAGIHAVYLVSHGWHLRRAGIAFRHFGLTALPVPVQRDAAPDFGLAEFIPRASALLMSYYALHEWIGCAWYSLRS